MELEKKKMLLCSLVRDCGRVVVAFSGGIDSSLLARIALDLLGPEAVTLVLCASPLVKGAELEQALRWVRANGCPQGVRLERLDWRPLDHTEIAGNDPERCYACKRRMYTLVGAFATARGIAAILDGTNADDLHSDRPGLRAVRELAIRTPLADVGLGKAEVRRLARNMGLSNWDQPSASCLATRLPVGLALTPARLAQVERWEQAVERLGFSGCRVRMLDASGERAWVEIAARDLDRLLRTETRAALVRCLRQAGAGQIAIDLAGRLP